MKQVWIAIVFIAAIFLVNFLYARRLNTFSDNITSIVEQAVYLADTDYDACGKCIENLLDELDDSALLLYSFSNRSTVDDIELASKAAAEYYRYNNKDSLKHELLMIVHRLEELKSSGEFRLENIL